jgi:hypothetical protein
MGTQPKQQSNGPMVQNGNAVKMLSVSAVSNTTTPCHSVVILAEYSKQGFAKILGIRKNIKNFDVKMHNGKMSAWQ